MDLYHEYAIKHAQADAKIGICHEIENKYEYSDSETIHLPIYSFK